MPDYQLGKIYKLVNDVDDEIYVGSTAVPYLSNRMARHRAAAKVHTGIRVYLHFGTIGASHFKIELLETFPCNSKAELMAREGHWVRQLKPSLNSSMPGNSTPEGRKEYQATYHAAHKEARNKQSREHYEEKWTEARARASEKIPCECGGHYSRAAKARHMQTVKHKIGLFRKWAIFRAPVRALTEALREALTEALTGPLSEALTGALTEA